MLGAAVIAVQRSVVSSWIHCRDFTPAPESNMAPHARLPCKFSMWRNSVETSGLALVDKEFAHFESWCQHSRSRVDHSRAAQSQGSVIDAY